MLNYLRDSIGTLRALRLARDNMVAAWPISFYRREFIAERILGRRIFIVNCPAGVQQVFVTNSRNYRKSPSNSATLTPLLGSGLFVSEGELWNRQRKVMTPAVAHSRMADYAKIVIAAGTEAVDAWKAKGDAGLRGRRQRALHDPDGGGDLADHVRLPAGRRRAGCSTRRSRTTRRRRAACTWPSSSGLPGVAPEPRSPKWPQGGRQVRRRDRRHHRGRAAAAASRRPTTCSTCSSPSGTRRASRCRRAHAGRGRLDLPRGPRDDRDHAFLGLLPPRPAPDGRGPGPRGGGPRARGPRRRSAATWSGCPSAGR
jgi:hypothetical protein